MSSNYNSNRRGGTGGRGGGNGNKRRNNNRGRGQVQATWDDSSDSNWRSGSNNDEGSNNNVAMGTTRTVVTTATEGQKQAPVEEVSLLTSSSDSSGNSSGDGTAIFNTADEGDDDDVGVNDTSSVTVQEVSSEEEEDKSVINASLIVNLSKSDVGGGVSMDTGVIEGGSPRGHGNGNDTIPVIDLADSSIEEVNSSVASLIDSPVRVVAGGNGELGSPMGSRPQSKEWSGSPKKITPISNQSSPQKRPISNDSDELSSDEEESSSTLADSEVEKLMVGREVGGMRRGRGVVEGLPGTVTVLKAPNGVIVYLVGTAHFSQRSQVDVAETIKMTQPTIVLLELCSSRKNILDLDEETVLKEVSEMNFQKVRLALSNSGTVQGTLHLLLLSMSAQLTKKLGMAPGGEFRVATREGRKIPGSVILLGDRPFNITISRALAALSVFQKIKLAWQFLTCNEDITREEIEKCKEKDLLERMLTEMTGEFPTITEVFVNERDVYLAHSLYLAATSEAHKSNGGPVVGVVGMGHVAGIGRNWGKTSDEMVDAIVRIPPTPLSTLIIRKSFKIATYALLGYGVYRFGRRLSIPDSIKKVIGGSGLVARFSDGVNGIVVR